MRSLFNLYTLPTKPLDYIFSNIYNETNKLDVEIEEFITQCKTPAGEGRPSILNDFFNDNLKMSVETENLILFRGINAAANAKNIALETSSNIASSNINTYLPAYIKDYINKTKFISSTSLYTSLFAISHYGISGNYIPLIVMLSYMPALITHFKAKKLHTELKNTLTNSQEFIANLRISINEKLDELKKLISDKAELVEEKAVETENLKTEYDNKIIKLNSEKSELHKQLDDKINEFSKKEDDLKEQHNKNVANLNNSFREQLDKMSTDKRAEIGSIKKSYENDLMKLNNEKEINLKEIKDFENNLNMKLGEIIQLNARIKKLEELIQEYTIKLTISSELNLMSPEKISDFLNKNIDYIVQEFKSDIEDIFQEIKNLWINERGEHLSLNEKQKIEIEALQKRNTDKTLEKSTGSSLTSEGEIFSRRKSRINSSNSIEVSSENSCMNSHESENDVGSSVSHTKKFTREKNVTPRNEKLNGSPSASESHENTTHEKKFKYDDHLTDKLNLRSSLRLPSKTNVARLAAQRAQESTFDRNASQNG